MTLSGKGKIYFLLNKIDDKKIITPKGQPILLHPSGDLDSHYPTDELLRLLYKFQNNHQKLKRKSLEKIWSLLKEIETSRQITAPEDNIAIPQVHHSKAKNEREKSQYSDERFTMLRKLEKESAIKEVIWPNNFDKLVHLKLGNRYFEVLNWYEKEYEKIIKNDPKPTESIQSPTNKPVYEITYSEQTREIIINGFLFKKLALFSLNDTIFSYLYKNPNTEKTGDEIKEASKENSIKDLNKFVEQLGFKGEFRQVFFKVSKSKIQFNNPITQEQLDEQGIKRLKF